MTPPRERRTAAAAKATTKKATTKKATTTKTATTKKATTKKATTKAATNRAAAKTGAAKKAATRLTSTPPAVEDGAVGTALISGETFTDKAVQFTNRDGYAIFEGDIILGRVDELRVVDEAAASGARDATRGLHEGVEPGSRVPDVDQPQGDVGEEAAVITGSGFRWAGGRIPFQTGALTNATAQTNLTNAITHWHNNTRLAFIARAGHADFANIRDATTCESQVGRRGGSQDILLASNCGFGASVHELGHAVGLWHEQSREDRDTFVTVNWANIQSGKSHNFNQHITDGDDVGGYDFGSIMHYGPTAFGTTSSSGATNTTITPKQALPAGVTMGQRNGLSIGDRAAVAQMYHHVYPNAGNTWVGRFEGGTQDQLLYYSPARHLWYLGRSGSSGALTFSQVGDTSGFGDLDDGRPFWVGDFNGTGSTTDILFYYPGDDNWWLGSMSGGQLGWSLVGNTAGFGHAITDGRPFWVGDFTGNGRTDVLFYYPGDDNWWLGEVLWGSMRWSLVGNTAGFGHAINDGRPFWVGNFSGPGKAEVLMYYPGDDNWWLGSVTNGQLGWSFVGNTAGFGHAINDGRPFWVGDFTGGGTADVLFYFPGDDNWWLGSIIGGQLAWSLVGNTAGFGHAINDGRPFWVGDFTGGGTADVLFYFPGDDNWWLGSIGTASAEDPQCAVLRREIAERRATIRALRASKAGLDPGNRADRLEILAINREISVENSAILAAQGTMARLGCPAVPNPGGPQLQWKPVGNTIGFGHAINDGRPFWTGDFRGDGSRDVLFHYRGDLNWWRGELGSGSLQWTLAATW